MAGYRIRQTRRRTICRSDHTDPKYAEIRSDRKRCVRALARIHRLRDAETCGAAVAVPLHAGHEIWRARGRGADPAWQFPLAIRPFMHGLRQRPFAPTKGASYRSRSAIRRSHSRVPAGDAIVYPRRRCMRLSRCVPASAWCRSPLSRVVSPISTSERRSMSSMKSPRSKDSR